MLMRNGIGIEIMEMPYRKKPCLAIYNEKENTYTKVATFNNWQTAGWFRNIFVNEFLDGLVDKKERLIHETTGND